MIADTRDMIRIANQEMSIYRACEHVGVHVPEYAGGSVKMYCPFGFLHFDGGESKAFRVYGESNSAYCFACGTRFTPVSLIATARDLPHRDAAEWILHEVGYVEPTYQARWEALAEQGPEIDRDALTEALKLACRRMDPQWEDRQFEDAVAKRFVACLALLPKVRTGQDAKMWLETTKTAMSRVLEGTRS